MNEIPTYYFAARVYGTINRFSQEEFLKFLRHFTQSFCIDKFSSDRSGEYLLDKILSKIKEVEARPGTSDWTNSKKLSAAFFLLDKKLLRKKYQGQCNIGRFFCEKCEEYVRTMYL